MTAGKAWLTLVTAITAWEIHALHHDPDQLLSRSLDRARATHPIANWAIHAAVTVTALHLTRHIPRRVDPFTVLARS